MGPDSARRQKAFGLVFAGVVHSLSFLDVYFFGGWWDEWLCAFCCFFLSLSPHILPIYCFIPLWFQLDTAGHAVTRSALLLSESDIIRLSTPCSWVRPRFGSSGLSFWLLVQHVAIYLIVLIIFSLATKHNKTSPLSNPSFFTRSAQMPGFKVAR